MAVTADRLTGRAKRYRLNARERLGLGDIESGHEFEGFEPWHPRLQEPEAVGVDRSDETPAEPVDDRSS